MSGGTRTSYGATKTALRASCQSIILPRDVASLTQETVCGSWGWFWGAAFPSKASLRVILRPEAPMLRVWHQAAPASNKSQDNSPVQTLQPPYILRESRYIDFQLSQYNSEDCGGLARSNALLKSPGTQCPLSLDPIQSQQIYLHGEERDSNTKSRTHLDLYPHH